MDPREQDYFQLQPSSSSIRDDQANFDEVDEILKILLKENTARITPVNREQDGSAESFDYNPHEEPFVKIIEEPASNLYRFRYRSEGETAGSIPGEKQQNGRKSFPKIMVCNHDGPAFLEVCCLTEDLKVHPNKLVRKLYIN